MRPALLATLATLLAASCATTDLRHGTPPAKGQWVVYPEAEVKDVKNVHDYKGAALCQRCHVDGGKKLLAADVPSLCLPCHPGAVKMTHVGKIQNPRPASLPFEPGGRIICYTCHDPHDVKAHKYGFRADYTKVCLECHTKH
jgi:predicted CXXCH cytochrome family protein